MLEGYDSTGSGGARQSPFLRVESTLWSTTANGPCGPQVFFFFSEEICSVFSLLEVGVVALDGVDELSGTEHNTNVSVGGRRTSSRAAFFGFECKRPNRGVGGR